VLLISFLILGGSYSKVNGNHIVNFAASTIFPVFFGFQAGQGLEIVDLHDIGSILVTIVAHNSVDLFLSLHGLLSIVAGPIPRERLYYSLQSSGVRSQSKIFF